MRTHSSQPSENPRPKFASAERAGTIGEATVASVERIVDLKVPAFRNAQSLFRHVSSRPSGDRGKEFAKVLTGIDALVRMAYAYDDAAKIEYCVELRMDFLDCAFGSLLGISDPALRKTSLESWSNWILFRSALANPKESDFLDSWVHRFANPNESVWQK